MEINHSTPLWPDEVKLTAGGLSLERAYGWLDNGYPDWSLDTDRGMAQPAESFTYDTFGQLEAVWLGSSGTAVESFSYDAAGNLTSRTDASGGSWTYGTAGLGVSGNQIPDRTTPGGVVETLGYDAAGRLTSVTSASGSASFAYDGLGRLRAKYEQGSLVLEVQRDAEGQVVATNDGSTATHHFAGYRFNEASGQSEQQLFPYVVERNGLLEWQLIGADQHVEVTIDEHGAETSTRRLAAYGEVLQSSGTPWQSSAFHGLRPDHAGLVSAGPRHLMVADGTWLQPEPKLVDGTMLDLSRPRTFAPYRYGANNPVFYNDPTGRTPKAFLAGMWFLAETGLTIADAHAAYAEVSEASATVANPAASMKTKAIAVVTAAATVTAAAVGAASLGGGAATGVRKIDDAIEVVTDMSRHADEAGTGAELAASASRSGEVTTLHRAVGSEELADIKEVGTVRPGKHMEGKWFAESPEDADQWGQLLHPDDEYSLIEADFPTEVVDEMFRLDQLDGVGPARYAEQGQLLDCCGVRTTE